MQETSPNPAAGYKFNSFQEIRSHSSILYNERLAILFYLLDMRAIDMNTNYRVEDIMYVRALLKQIYKNMRMLVRFNPVARASLNLETKDGGIYVTDVALGMIDGMIDYCEVNGYTARRIYILARELDKFEMLIKDVLQYYNYFIRPEFRQKPDIDVATERYMEIADKNTIEELRSIVGRNSKIDFESLGSKRIELREPVENEDEDDEVVYGAGADFIDVVNEQAEKEHFDDIKDKDLV
jgi:hypothetical protein